MMKKRFWFALFVISLMLSLSLISSLEIEQKNIKKEFLVESTIQIKSSDFLNKKYNSKFDISYEDSKESPKKILGGKISLGNRFGSLAKNTNEEDFLRKFLKENQDELKIDEKNLDLRKIEIDPGIIPEQDSIKYVSFIQEYNKVLIYNSYVNFIMINNDINTLSANYFDMLNLDVTPKISSDEVAKIIIDHLNISNHYFNVENISLVIFPIKSNEGYDYILTWMISLPFNKEKQSSLVLFVNSDNGNIVYSYDRIKEASLGGYVSGEIYEKNPLILKKEKYFKSNYIYLNNLTNLHYYSGKGNNLNNSLTLRNRISLTNKKNIKVEFSTKYDLEVNYDYVFLDISSDNGLTWDTLSFFNGQSNGWINRSINLSSYSESNILLRFSYVTDSSVIREGFFLDDIKIIANNSLIFFDNAENNSSPWIFNGFYKTGEIGNVLLYQTTNQNGFYNISNLVNNSIIRSELKGPYVDVNIFNGNDSEFLFRNSTIPKSLNWSWKDYDNSYKQEESNTFYHVNRIHDYFVDIFNITSMNYQTKATLEYPGFCNAYSDGTDIYFLGAGGGCESTALGRDIIYHEYTHSVIYHIYPYFLRSDMHEAFADYFASTLTDSPLVGEGIWSEPIRNLKNNNRFPSDIIGEPHYDSLILSGALWDLRFDLGKEYADKLVMSAMKANSNSYQEVLENMLVVDDNNGYLYDGTTHILSICHAFLDNHGIYSPYCIGHTQYPISRIDFPADNEDLYGNIIQIKGTVAAAADGYIQKYTLEYNNGTEWIIIKESSWSQITEGILGLWDISSIPKGEYTLRLNIIDNYGNSYIENKKIYRDIPNINKAAIICQNSSCIASSNMIRSRDNISNISEPNQPNTFTNCKDGSFGEYLVDESIENITVTDLNNTQFLVGDTIKIDIWVYCWGAYADYLRIKYSSDIVTPNWDLKYLDYCNSTGFMKFSNVFKLDNRVGYHAVRGMFGYSMIDINDNCDKGYYSDNDDIIILAKDITPPTISLLSPVMDSIFNSKDMSFEFIAEDNINLSSCKINIYKINGESSLIEHKDKNDIINNSSANFSINNLDSGNYKWQIECEDTSNNTGFSEIRTFSVDVDKIKINIQNNSFVNITKIFINISLTKKVDSLKYFDNGGKFVELCKDCDNFSGYLKLGHGIHNMKFNASSLEEREIVFFIDTKNPKISWFRPSNGQFTNGLFYIGYSEENQNNLKIYINDIEILNRNLSSNKNNHIGFFVNISQYDGKEVHYKFKVTDISGNAIFSRLIKVKVDTTAPEIQDFKAPVVGRYVYFNMTILNEDKNSFNKVEYIDSFDGAKTRWKSLCTTLGNNICYKKVSFKAGNHNITIRTSDRAGNSVEQSINFIM